MVGEGRCLFGEIVFVGFFDWDIKMVCELFGVVVCIIFWNFFVFFVFYKVFVVLIVGNIVVWKLVLEVVFLVKIFMEVLYVVGFLKGIINLFMGLGRIVG